MVESTTPTDILMFSLDLPIDALLTEDANLAQNWILDSRSSFHITPHREWFSTYTEGSFGTVRLGDAHAIAITGMGDICLAFQNGMQFMLHNVRHVPDLAKSLISVG